MTTTLLEAVVVARSAAAPSIAVFELAPAGDEEFPSYTAGAHIDVLLDQVGLVRQYSLCDPPGGEHYRVAVLDDPNSRGGSRAMHQLEVGDRVRISAPRNRFPLVPAQRHVLFAGGIGVTPLLSMARTMDLEGGDYAMHYCARSREQAAFVSELAENPRVFLHFDDGDPDQLLEVEQALGPPSPDTAVYVCGPNGFMDHVLARAEAIGWSAEALHTERFTNDLLEGDGGETGAFTVRLVSKGVEYPVPEDRTILDVLVENGIDAPSSCQQGICGECIVKVVEGEPDHRDAVLSDQEKADGLFTPCCSRSHSPVLALDI